MTDEMTPVNTLQEHLIPQEGKEWSLCLLTCMNTLAATQGMSSLTLLFSFPISPCPFFLPILPPFLFAKDSAKKNSIHRVCFQAGRTPS